MDPLIPIDLKNSEKELNLKTNVFSFGNKERVFQARYATIQKSESNKDTKVVEFNYNPKDTYSIYITIDQNSNFGECKKKDIKAASNKKIPNKINAYIPHLDIEPEKYIIEANIQRNEDIGNQQQQLIKIRLSRETTSITQATEASLKKIRKDAFGLQYPKKLELFDYELQAYNIIQIKTSELNLDKIEPEKVSSIAFLLLETEEQFIDLFSVLLYAMLFSANSLENYINKYILDIIIQFVHFPFDPLFQFIKSFNKKELKEDMQKLIEISYQNKIDYIERKINAKETKYFQFVKIHTNYDTILNEKFFNLVLTQDQKNNLMKAIDTRDKGEIQIENKEDSNDDTYMNIISSFKPLTFDCLEKFANDIKIDPLMTLTLEFEKLNRLINPDNKPISTETINKYFISLITKQLIGLITYKGFFSIEAIINDEDQENCSSCKNPESNRVFNNLLNAIISKGMSCLNSILKMNEGYSHKHISVNELSFNFNSNNIIHIFQKSNDSSPKNKLRFFDIPFHQSWLMKIASIILSIYTKVFGLFSFDNHISIENKKKRFTENTVFIRELFKSCVNSITEEFFESYANVLPNYFGFCENMVLVPLKGYRCVDNVCQHFANTSSNILIQRSCMFFVPYDDNEEEVFNKYKKPIPNFKAILEPYLIMSDDKICHYAKSHEKDGYLRSINFNEEAFNQNVKNINIEKEYLKKNPIDLSSISDSDIFLFDYEKNARFNCNNLISYDYLFLLNYSFQLDFIGNNELFNLLLTWRTNNKTQAHVDDKTKDGLIALLKKKHKIKSKGERMAYLYYDYMKFVSSTDLQKRKSTKQFVKIGYFLIHLSSFISEDNFFETKWYKDTFASHIEILI